MTKPTILSLALLLVNSIHGQQTAPEPSDYNGFVAPYKVHKIGHGSFPVSLEVGSRPDSKLIIAEVTDATSGDVISFPFRGSRGIEISRDGRVGSWDSGPFGTHGGCCSQIAPDDLKNLDAMVDNLPSDEGVLPPNEHRLVIQKPHGEAFVVRVYDPAKLPDPVLDVLRLTRSFGSLVPRPKTDDLWHANSDGDIQAAAFSSTQAAVSGRGGPITIWSLTSHARVGEVPLPVNAYVSNLVFTRDGSKLIGTDWGCLLVIDIPTLKIEKLILSPVRDVRLPGFSNPTLINDDRFLRVESDPDPDRTYSTKTWEEVRGLPTSAPPDAIRSVVAADSVRVVYTTADKHIWLRRDRENHDVDLTNDIGGEFLNASFSPDGRKVVVTDVANDPNGESNYRHVRIRLLDSWSGAIIEELRPFEQRFCNSARSFTWLADQKYLIALTQPNDWMNGEDISVWQLSTGRHLAELNGCNHRMVGFAVTNEKIIAACPDGSISEWKMKTALP